MNILYNLHPYLGHAFGARYDLPIPLFLFVLGGAGIVLLSFILVLPTVVKAAAPENRIDAAPASQYRWVPATLSFAVLACLALAGWFGSQELAENILPTWFWLIVWIAVPLSAGFIGDYTHHLNPFANIAKLASTPKIRQAIISRSQPLAWPQRLGWWPAVALYFMLAIGELIFNQFATMPVVIASGLALYLVVSAFMGLLFGAAWLAHGEIFNVLFSTWGRLGYFRFGAPGRRGFAGGLIVGFEPSASRVAFVLLLLVAVAFDGLLATPIWNSLQHRLPAAFGAGTLYLQLLTVAALIIVTSIIWAGFGFFARAAAAVGGKKLSALQAFAGLLPSLLPISFGYLLAHNLQYLVTNIQLLFPLIGNPIGRSSWPLPLAYPFNDSYEVNLHVLNSAFYWYTAIIVIVIVHIFAVVLAHRYLGASASNVRKARRAEYPWVVAMVGYTMLSLWLLAQPLVEERPAESRAPSAPAEISHLV